MMNANEAASISNSIHSEILRKYINHVEGSTEFYETMIKEAANKGYKYTCFRMGKLPKLMTKEERATIYKNFFEAAGYRVGMNDSGYCYIHW